jgi:hypothetical protein
MTKYMKKIIFSLLILISLILVQPVMAVSEAGPSGVFKSTIYSTDQRVVKLQAYLESHNSPLAPYADVFVEKADQYGLLDWKLVAAISGVESTFGKAIPYNSYNAYGWANGKYSFSSWEESIDVVTKTLKFNYMNKGLDTVEKIAPVYAPPSTTWGNNVKFFMKQIDDFLPSHAKQLTITL